MQIAIYSKKKITNGGIKRYFLPFEEDTIKDENKEENKPCRVRYLHLRNIKGKSLLTY